MSEVLSVQLLLLVSDMLWWYSFFKIIIYLLLSPDKVIYFYEKMHLFYRLYFLNGELNSAF